MRIEKTVFISYRRTNVSWALAIYQYLRNHEYDVFFDYSSISSGNFEQIIIDNIKSRAHFLVILTPSALERCDEPNDWLRREIETALDEKRNIIPVFFEGFNFGSPSISKYLTGKLSNLSKYNGVDVPVSYFEEAMARIHNRYLNIPLDLVLHPASPAAQAAATKEKKTADTKATVTERTLSADEWFEQGYKHGEVGDYDDAIRCYTEALRFDPDNSYAYYNRGIAHQEKGDLEGAIQDYNIAIRLDPSDTDAYSSRGNARQDKGDLEGAIQDYNIAIRLKTDDADIYNDRAWAYYQLGKNTEALRDVNKSLELQPSDAAALHTRGSINIALGNTKQAIDDFEAALKLEPDLQEAINDLAKAKKLLGK
jgi:tetratricopeptide (TPR) repeat protein